MGPGTPLALAALPSSVIASASWQLNGASPSASTGAIASGLSTGCLPSMELSSPGTGSALLTGLASTTFATVSTSRLLTLFGAGTWPLVPVHSSLLTAASHQTKLGPPDSVAGCPAAGLLPVKAVAKLFVLVHSHAHHSAGLLLDCFLGVFGQYRTMQYVPGPYIYNI